jgi:leucyl aminopeptidase
LPIQAKVTAAPAAGSQSLGTYLTGLAEGEASPAVLVIPVRSPDGPPETPVPGAGAAELETYLGVSPADVIACDELTGRAGETAQSVIKLGDRPCAVLFLGIGDASAAALRRAGAALVRRLPAGRTALTTAVLDAPDDNVQAFTEGLLLGSYQFAMKSDGPAAAGPAEVRLLLAGPNSRAEAVRRASLIAGAVALARDLANTPSMIKSPGWLADEAVRVADEHGLSSRVWTEAELASDGFGGLLGVGSGSVRPPRLIELSYQPAQASQHVVLIGKGITFDSGGLSLKPNDNMKMMKTDMAGGAAVIAAMSALAGLGVQARVTGLVAAAENMPSGTALRVGDVIKHYGGRTVEVLNTDAEGRLILADAITYAKQLGVTHIVDAATLTGAIVVALANVNVGVFGSNQEFTDKLLASAKAAGEKMWQMPMDDEYREFIKGSFADLQNIGSGKGGGSITGAWFIREFAGDTPWIHLDIAGTAWNDDAKPWLAKGPTGVALQTLVHLVQSY